ncbi:hypothetical protein NMG60_11009377 [Bertholletia excelsa]
MEVVATVACLALGFSILSFLVLKWNEIKYSRRKGLPPGTMGWPLFGETTDFLKQGPDFMKNQKARYGSLFKSHVLGNPTIVSMDPELNRYILLNESKGLLPGYPQSTLDILGRCNIAAIHGAAHKRVRGSMLSLISRNVFKDHNLLPRVDHNMRTLINNLDGKTVDIQEITFRVALFISFKLLMEDEPDSVYETFRTEFNKLFVGSISLPIYLPGSNYYKGFQGRRNVLKILTGIMAKRRNSSPTHNDMLEQLLKEEDPRYKLSDEEILDQVITILYSGYETVSTTSMMAIKYLHDHPATLQELRVILETQRLATVVNGLLRKTTQDMEFNGFVIPKGWRIYVYNREINYDPFIYPEPLTFNPWRWLDKSMESHHYCFLFGGGGRLCPGKELGIVTISTFLHYFVTKYRWEEVGRDKIVKFPRVEAPNGLHVRVSKY